MKYLLRTTLLSLLFCAALLSTSALAAGETTYLWQASDNTIRYITATTAPTALNSTTDGTALTTTTITVGSDTFTYYDINSAGTYRLAEDITLDKPILVTGTVTLDLNGYVLKYHNDTVGATGSVIRVGDSSASPVTTGSLTLTDSRANDPTATHTFRVDSANNNLWVLDATGDKTVSGGIITGGTGGTGTTGSGVRGGGVYVDKGSTFTMSDGNIVGCTAANGGGVYVLGGGSDSDADKFTMTGGSIRGCTASNGNGGGVYLENSGAKFEMSGDNTLIAYCTANNGGGVSAGGDTTFNMSGGATISKCTANGGVSGSTPAQGGGVYVNSNNCTLRGGTIKDCTATGDGVGGPKGGGVFVFAEKTLIVGGGSTALTITDNTSGAITAYTSDDISLGTDNSTGKIGKITGSLPSGITLTGSDLDLSTTDSNITNPDDGYDWNSGTNTLTLRRATFNNIKLKNDNTIIKIEGTVTVNKIGNMTHNYPLTIKGENTNPSLTVKDSLQLGAAALTLQDLTANIGSISCDTNTNDLTLTNANITTTNINWAHNTGSVTTNGLVLTNSSLTVNGDSSNGICAGQIKINDNASSINLNGGYISTNDAGNLQASGFEVLSYCPLGGNYSIGPDPDSGDGSSPTRYLLKNNVKVTGITLLKTPLPPASTPSDDGPTYYRITVSEPVNGTVEASAKRATSGKTVTVTVSPASGYDLETLTVLDRRDREVKLTALGDGKYTFKMPSSNVTVSAHFTLLPDFDDVDPEDYFYDALRWAVNNDVTDGIGGGKFGPDLTCTRAQIVTFLWRTSGRPIAARTEMPFSDVAPESYYHDAVLWAIETGITTGTSATTFSPDLTCTREQAVAFLYRYAVYNGIDVSAGEDTNILSYTDAISVADYAFPAFQWAVGAGVVRGADAKLMPADPCTRAQIITMLYRTMNP